MGEERVGGETVTLIRLHVVVEGQTEEGFINEVLAPELGPRGIFVDAHSITTGRKHGRLFRGGGNRYGYLQRDLIRWMKQDQNPDAWFTTMVDLYRLPTDFPGLAACSTISESRLRVECLEGEFGRDVREQLADNPVHQRFIPHIQLHEFEALLFANPDMFLEAFPDRNEAVAQLRAIRALFECPEDINEGDATAPSKRILELLPEFSKPVSGLLIVKHIGLATLCAQCPHFNSWVTRILQLSPN